VIEDTDPKDAAGDDGVADATAPKDSDAGPSVEFVSEMTPLQLANVLTVVTLTGPFTIAVMLSGPVVLAVGALAGSAEVTVWGALLSVALPAVPLAAFGVSYVRSLRRESIPVLAPVRVRFESAGLSIETGEDRRYATWDHFTRWRRAAGAYVLHTAPRTFIVLRDAGMASETSIAVEAFLRAGVPNGPRRRREPTRDERHGA
jgi:hypothetical protein